MDTTATAPARRQSQPPDSARVQKAECLNSPMCRELSGLLLDKAPEDGVHTTAIPGVDVFRKDSPSDFVCAVYEPALCLIAQGSKLVKLGDKEIFYGPLTYMVSTVGLPVSGQVAVASAQEPYLAIKVAIDPKEVADVVLEVGDRQPEHQGQCSCGLSVAPCSGQVF